MQHALDEQMEFANFPKRNSPAPVEDARELHETLVTLLADQSSAQRVQMCQKLIAGAYSIHTFYVVANPTRIEACEPNRARFGRKVVLRRDRIIETILTVLANVTTQQQIA